MRSDKCVWPLMVVVTVVVVIPMFFAVNFMVFRAWALHAPVGAA